MGLFAELKRRNVIRVAILYVVTAWLMLQAADVGMSALGLPDWTGKLVLFLLALGFPIALIFSWIYELTPEGIKRESEIDRTESITGHTGHRINITIGVLLVLAIVVVVADRLVVDDDAPSPAAAALAPPADEAEVDDKSIAVLPFANLSGNPDEDYFSDGMTEEILNVLAKNTALKVAARTSVFKFKGQGGDIRQIGEELGVGHVIEGSVRRDGERIRVTAQLIRVDDGFHVWSETYDRELKSVFAIQDDIARRIADALEATLGAAGADAPEPRGDVDPAAYEDYLKGRALYRARSDIPRAIGYFEETVELAPEMAAAWASLTLSLEVAHWFVSPLERAALGDVIGRMRMAAERAAALEPRSAMTLHALANVARADLRFAEAERLYLQSIAADPTYPDVREDYAEFLYHLGFPDESLAASRELVALEPLVWVFWGRIGDVGTLLDRDDLIEEYELRMQELAPTADFGVLARYGQSFSHGRFEEARELLGQAYRKDPASAGPGRALFLWSMGEPGMDDEMARFMIRRKSVFVQYAIPRGDSDLFFEAARLAHVPEARYTLHYSLGLPIAAPLLSDPRARAVIRDLGFEAYWRQRGWPALCRPLGDDDFECGPDAGEGT